ncbi:hypothetical protein KAR91_21260 [Candidatus Pacearchaeota archaeon]|nr:hypothetical protein [Candidatus Pacearchaeota archaeon]
MIEFTEKDIGCHADCIFGHQHRRSILANYVRKIVGIKFPSIDPTLVNELHAEPTDDFSEEDDAIEILQSVTDDSLVWALEAGDLLLMSKEDYNC